MKPTVADPPPPRSSFSLRFGGPIAPPRSCVPNVRADLGKQTTARSGDNQVHEQWRCICGTTVSGNSKVLIIMFDICDHISRIYFSWWLCSTKEECKCTDHMILLGMKSCLCDLDCDGLEEQGKTSMRLCSKPIGFFRFVNGRTLNRPFDMVIAHVSLRGNPPKWHPLDENLCDCEFYG